MVDWTGRPRGLGHPSCWVSSVSSAWPLPTVKWPRLLPWSLGAQKTGSRNFQDSYQTQHHFHPIPLFNHRLLLTMREAPCMQEGRNGCSHLLAQLPPGRERELFGTEEILSAQTAEKGPLPAALGWPDYQSSKVKFE